MTGKASQKPTHTRRLLPSVPDPHQGPRIAPRIVTRPPGRRGTAQLPSCCMEGARITGGQDRAQEGRQAHPGHQLPPGSPAGPRLLIRTRGRGSRPGSSPGRQDRASGLACWINRQRNKILHACLLCFILHLVFYDGFTHFERFKILSGIFCFCQVYTCLYSLQRHSPILPYSNILFW